MKEIIYTRAEINRDKNTIEKINETKNWFLKDKQNTQPFPLVNMSSRMFISFIALTTIFVDLFYFLAFHDLDTCRISLTFSLYDVSHSLWNTTEVKCPPYHIRGDMI